ncbi:unnamed protein product [Pelagomonas calceolata]|uniref:phosphatidylinositol-3,5-bisphosphate 3-phosphatase n=2 Tax=Pelagomonas calceolata TaxID=35677 RepID=A0A7S3ZWH8_9STRA|nr:unnamed protein product [Pelagomonas calceolata]
MAARPWMDDGASQHCLLCHQAFSFTNRRHHCRSCARLVCGACSSRSMRLESIQRPSSSIRNVGTQLAKTTLATAASMLTTTTNESERVCDDCWARLGRGRSATPPPPSHHADDDVAYDAELMDVAADGIRNIALEVRAPDGRVLSDGNSFSMTLPSSTRVAGAYVIVTARDKSKSSAVRDDVVGRGRVFLEEGQRHIQLLRDGGVKGTVLVKATRSSAKKPLQVATIPPQTSKHMWPVALSELYPPGTTVHDACFEHINGTIVPASEQALDAFADVDRGCLIVTSHRFLHVAHTLDVISVPHASILNVEVVQRDDALVLVLTTRSYKSITFSSRSATNRDWSWCRSEWQWRVGEDRFYARPEAVVTADHDDNDDEDEDTELLSRLGLNDLDDRALRRNRLKRFIEPQKERAPSQSGADVDLGAEFARQGVATDARWRFTQANSSYDLCATYPPLLIVPAALSDARLKEGSRWRSKRRVPVLTWYDRASGAALIRASQPKSGITGAHVDDAALLHVRAAAARSRGAVAARLDDPTAFDDEEGFANSSPYKSTTAPILRICDCRSIVAAKANQLAGRGHETTSKLGGSRAATLEFLDLENFHVIRNAKKRLSEASTLEDYYRALHESRWPVYVQALISAAKVVADHLDRGDPCFVHCSDGWDRTPQVCALAQIIVDPYFRTIKGFAVLIEKDFCAFGHPFAMRSGSKGEGEAGPVFDQFLECVQSLRRGAPASFEFTESLLALLKEHVYSRFFGNFLRDSDAERCGDDAVSVWRVVESDPGRFSSPVYDSSASRRLPVLSKPSADVELELLRARIRALEK